MSTTINVFEVECVWCKILLKMVICGAKKFSYFLFAQISTSYPVQQKHTHHTHIYTLIAVIDSIFAYHFIWHHHGKLA